MRKGRSTQGLLKLGFRTSTSLCQILLATASYKFSPDSRNGGITPSLKGSSCKELWSFLQFTTDTRGNLVINHIFFFNWAEAWSKYNVHIVSPVINELKFVSNFFFFFLPLRRSLYNINKEMRSMKKTASPFGLRKPWIF